MNNYQKYQERVCNTIKECLDSMECQPILFVGSGFSRRYFNGLNWEELLRKLAEENPLSKQFAYYKQTYKDNIEIGSQLAEEYKEWAWGEGRKEFSNEIFSEQYNGEIYIKNKVRDIIQNIMPSSRILEWVAYPFSRGSS